MNPGMALRHQVKALPFIMLALLVTACSSPEFKPCDEDPITGAGGASSSSSGEGGSGADADPPLVCDFHAECATMSEWCTGVYLWPNTWSLIQQYGEPRCYCACGAGGSQCTNDPGGSTCGLLKNPDGTNFFPDNDGWTNGRPYVCVLDETTPSQPTKHPDCP